MLNFCPNCNGDLKHLYPKKSGIISIHDDDKISCSGEVSYARLPARITAAQLSGSYISGIAVDIFECVNCGNLSFLRKKC
jgi:hypothetical protein